VTFVSAEQGAFLRAAPQGGKVVAVLQRGTPVRRILENRDGWVRVQLLDESEGWVFAELLSGERSAP
jgi:SH3-like domain-containing protein